MKDLDVLEAKIGYRFRNRELLITALTHSSYANEHGKENAVSYERLEFLGDALLGLKTAEFLYDRQPLLPEGRMTRVRAELVREERLHTVAQRLNLGAFMRLGKGEEHTGGRERPSILADMVEAVLAAVYLDGGMEAAERFVSRQVLRDAEAHLQNRSPDHKTVLQELVQRSPNSTISYRVLEENGPEHDKRFKAAVYVNGVLKGSGEGRSKKEAEQAAAGAALVSF